MKHGFVFFLCHYIDIQSNKLEEHSDACKGQRPSKALKALYPIIDNG